MQIAKKQLLGFGGLALVVAMTAFATTLPTGAVSRASGDVEIVVQVYGTNLETVINSPLDGEVYSNSKIDFSETHSHADDVTYVLQKLNADGTVAEEWALTAYDIHGSDVSGVTEFTLDLEDYGGTGVYVFRSAATKSDTGATQEDAVQFTYAAIDADQDDVEVKNDDKKVSFKVSYTSGIKSLAYQIYDKDGNAVGTKFVTNTSTPATGGSMDLTIDFSSFNLSTGDYTIRIEGYDEFDAGGDLIDTASVKFHYTAPEEPDEPVTPVVPDTGSLLSALNISRADYLITGLIGFVGISIIALIAIRRSKRN